MPRHAPPPVYPSRAWWAEMVAAGALGLTAFVAAAHGSAFTATAAERFTTAPEASEPIAHGGPLAVPSIGVVAPEIYTDRAVGVNSAAATASGRSISARPSQRPVEPRRTVGGSTGARTAVPEAPRDVPAAGNTLSATTTTPDVTATRPETTAETTTTTAETTEAATTSATATTAEATTESATTTATTSETTGSEPDAGDVLASLIEEATR